MLTQSNRSSKLKAGTLIFSRNKRKSSQIVLYRLRSRAGEYLSQESLEHSLHCLMPIFTRESHFHLKSSNNQQECLATLVHFVFSKASFELFVGVQYWSWLFVIVAFTLTCYLLPVSKGWLTSSCSSSWQACSDSDWERLPSPGRDLWLRAADCWRHGKEVLCLMQSFSV